MSHCFFSTIESRILVERYLSKRASSHCCVFCVCTEQSVFMSQSGFRSLGSVVFCVWKSPFDRPRLETFSRHVHYANIVTRRTFMYVRIGKAVVA